MKSTFKNAWVTPQKQLVLFYLFNQTCSNINALPLFLQIVQLVLGIVAVVLAIVNIILSTDNRGIYLAMIASGIWTGCMVRCC